MKKTDEKQNPLHREYGLMSNIRWTLSAMRQHSKGLLTLIPIGIVCAPLMNYLWTFISKFVIDMITGEVGWLALLWIIGIFTVIQLVSTMLNTYYNSETGWRFIDTRFKLIGEKNRKVMTIDFEHLENPDVMDCYQKASIISCTWREVLGAFKDFNLTPGKKVIVVGSGPVGLSFVKLGKLFGLGQIDIVDMLPAKLEVARRMGADNGYTPAEISTPEFIAAANRSYDAVIDAVGLDVVVNSVLPLVKMGGDVCVYGVMTKNPTFDLSKAPYNFDLHMHQWPTRSEEKAAMTTLAQWIEEGRLSASDFITHRFAIEEIEEAFAAVKRGEVLKCVLTF